MTEEFALDHAGRQRTETGGHKRPVPPWTVGVDGAGGQILAGAGLAGDEHWEIGRRNQRDLFEDLLHRQR